MSFLRRPHSVFLRKAAFQIHLWVGVILALYFIVIGISGSILVFRHEIGEWMSEPPPPIQVSEIGEMISPQVALNLLQKHYEGKPIFNLGMPRETYPAYTAGVLNHQFITVSLNPYTGEIIREQTFKDTWLNFTARLHLNLTFGRTGAVANGWGGAFLLLISVTGMVIWWQGIRNWARGLQVDFKKNWKRINFDLHSAAGFWIMGWILIWGGTTIYLVWPTESKRIIERFSPLSKTAEIVVPPREASSERPLNNLIAGVQLLYPKGKLTRIIFPRSEKQAMVIEMARTEIGDYANMDFVHIDPSTGKHIGTSHGAEKPKTAGDWFVWLMAPIHFGDRWGLTVKIIWAIAGISLPLLSITGLLMYWNRYLSKKWKQKINSVIY